MNKHRNGRQFVRHAWRVALCYLIALQAFLAAYGTAFAISKVDSTGADFVICHGAGDDAPVSPLGGVPASVPCALCAMAASAGGPLPDPIVTAVAPPTFAHQVCPRDAAALDRLPPKRTGLARAPPTLA